MDRAITAILVLVGLVNALPLIGLLGAERLSSLYGIEIQQPDLLVLMRHRAVLLGLLGGFMIFAAFRPVLRPSAFVLGLASMAAFMLLAWSAGGNNALLGRVVIVDLAASALLVLAVLLETFAMRPVAS